MIKLRFLYIFSIACFWLLACPSAWAQELNSTDTLQSDQLSDTTIMIEGNQEMISQQADSLPGKKFLSGMELKLDYGKLLLMWSEFETKYELGINLRFYERVVLVTEFGGAELNPLKAYDNALYYTVDGMYGRVGLDYYTSYDPSNFYYAGIRYAVSNFSDEGMFLLDSEYWPEYEEGFGSEDVTAAWFEIVLGTETYLKLSAKAKETGKTPWILGWNGRLRFLTDFENREEPRIYSIPGYGRTFNNMVAALNFYVKYRFGN